MEVTAILSPNQSSGHAQNFKPETPRHLEQQTEALLELQRLVEAAKSFAQGHTTPANLESTLHSIFTTNPPGSTE